MAILIQLGTALNTALSNLELLLQVSHYLTFFLKLSLPESCYYVKISAFIRGIKVSSPNGCRENVNSKGSWSKWEVPEHLQLKKSVPELQLYTLGSHNHEYYRWCSCVGKLYTERVKRVQLTPALPEQPRIGIPQSWGCPSPGVITQPGFNAIQ